MRFVEDTKRFFTLLADEIFYTLQYLRRRRGILPGEILNQEFLKPLRITQYRLAKDISVPSRRINEIVRGTRAISADTALRLARFFGTSAEFWLNLQAHYDLEAQKDKLENRLKLEVKIFKLRKGPISSRSTKRLT